jgi:hypothetical protein
MTAAARVKAGGPTGIDFPTLKGREARQQVDSVLAEYLPAPAERTAMNGFGFVQVVRPRSRASLIDLAADRPAFEARALLRRAGTEIGATRLAAHPSVVRVLEGQQGWLDRLARQVGGEVTLRSDASLAMSAGHAERA